EGELAVRRRLCGDEQLVGPMAGARADPQLPRRRRGRRRHEAQRERVVEDAGVRESLAVEEPAADLEAWHVHAQEHREAERTTVDGLVEAGLDRVFGELAFADGAAQEEREEV